MRDLALVLGMLFYVPMVLRFPATGVLCWAWFSIMNPHRELYGFAAGQPLNSIIAVATLVGWLASRERKRWTPDAMPWLLAALVAWMTLDTFFGYSPGYSWVFWDRVVRIFALIFVIFILMTTKARVQAMIWVIVISLGFYGVKGGVFTIAHGGHAIVYGPADSVYNDNNQLALAVVSELPLLLYLTRHTKAAWLRWGMIVALVLQVVMVFGSYSRGGVIALAVMGFMTLMRSDRKILYALLGVVAVGLGLMVMPDSFYERLNTINSISSDDSFQGRVMAWHVAFRCAVDFFPFGAGLYAPQIETLYHVYFPGADVHAAHSIYFQILGEHGFFALGIYMLILMLGVRNAGRVIRQTRKDPALFWARDLADMARVSLISFYVGGAALSMAYSDVYLILIALMSTLRELTDPARIEERAIERRRRLVPLSETRIPIDDPLPAPVDARYSPGPSNSA
jgi:probable O-glycosylation ligase (exosortase A-associated)